MTMINLKSRHDGAAIPAFHMPAGGSRKAGLVVAQEIFGVNANIRAVCALFAAQGYEVIAPEFFARIEPGFDAGYDAAGIAKGRAAVEATSWDQVAGDLQAAIDALAGPVFVTGFCWGGTAAWIAACRCTGISAAAGFYGRMIVGLLGEEPKAPVALFYGEKDAHIPAADIAAVRAAHPLVPVHVYPAGHGFFSDRGGDFDEAVRDRAWADAEAFFAESLLPRGLKD